MAAPEIPNLLAMRGGGRGGRGGGLRGGRRGGLPGAQERADQLVRETDADASGSRLSAVNAGYFKDDYAREFMVGPQQMLVKRFPIINRGTYVRTFAIDTLVSSFITAVGPYAPKQIISLGAGTDTRFWRLRDITHPPWTPPSPRYPWMNNSPQPKLPDPNTYPLTTHLLYHEIDFPSTAAQKLAAVRSSRLLSPAGSNFATLLHDPSRFPNPNSVQTWGYLDNMELTQGFIFHPADLRSPNLDIPHIRTDIPTLIISECCLCYMQPEEAHRAVEYFRGQLQAPYGIVMYEPINPDDAFGKMMKENLALRGLSMPTVEAFPTFQKQVQRLDDAGFTSGRDCASVDWLWEVWVSHEERFRIDHLEMVDEVEEWKLLGDHYLVSWAWEAWGSEVFRGWEESCKGWVTIEKAQGPQCRDYPCGSSGGESSGDGEGDEDDDDEMGVEEDGDEGERGETPKA